MIHVWIFVHVTLNVCCLKFAHGSGRNVEELLSRERRQDVAESDHGYFSCRYNEPPENAQYLQRCAVGECGVTSGDLGQNGTTRITRCEPHHTLVHGYETDICHNGDWSTTGHKCVQCGRSPRIFEVLEPSALIFGGENSLKGNFPWMAAVFTHQTYGQWILMCGGTLISPSIVLTAGHCLYNGNKTKPEDIQVGFGRLSANISTNETGSILSSVEKTVLPNRFVGHNRLYDLDIGLLVLKKDVLLSAFIMPACIDWSGTMNPKPNETGILAGWGLANEVGFRSDNLKWTNQKYIDYQQCRTLMKASDKKFLSPDKFCADHVRGEETETGDNGGGLTFVRDEVHYVYGIVSTKMFMKAKNLRLYTNLTDEVHLAWLKKEWRELQTQQRQDGVSALSSFNKMSGCNKDAECPDNMRCVGQTCLNLCPGACGTNSVCRMANHLPVCSCPPGYRGNPYASCTGMSGGALSTTNRDKEQTGCRWFTSPSTTGGVPVFNDTCSTNDNQLNLGQVIASKQGEFPYLGIIGDEKFKVIHNGILISEQWFLSTASCYSSAVCNKKVKLGITDGSSSNAQSMPVYDVVEERLHPGFKSYSIDNVGLFKLNTIVRFTQFIRPACLVEERQLSGTKGVVIGKLNGVLSKTTTELLPESKCKGITSDFKDESMLCVNIYRSKDSLRMYAGFPMMGPISQPYCKYGLLGLATFGNTSQPEGYMRLSHYLPWIETIVRP